MILKGKFKWRWETLLTCYSAVDVVDPSDAGWARVRHYEMSLLGYSISWDRSVDRPVELARSIEPWAALDALLHLFRKGF